MTLTSLITAAEGFPALERLAASAQEDRARQASGSPSKSAKRLDIKPTQKLI